MRDRNSGGRLESDGVTVVMSVYNEAPLVGRAVAEVVTICRSLGRPFQVWIVDDGSSDWTEALEQELMSDPNVVIRHNAPNRGKGAVMNEVFPLLKTPWTVVIDADREYPAHDIPAVLAPLIQGRADWVFGARYGFGRKRPRQYLATYLANQVFSATFSALSRMRFRDVLTGLFAFRTAMAAGIRLEQERFSYTPELLWKVHHRHHPRWLDVPIGYRFRTYKEGKKIHWWETFTVLFAIVRYRFTATHGAT